MKNAINIIIAFVTIIIVCGCPTPFPVEDSFIASIEQVTNASDYNLNVSWSAGDEVLIECGGNFIERKIFVTESKGDFVELKSEFEDEEVKNRFSPPYKAYYPVANDNSIPEEYQYDDRVSYLPLYAESNDHTLHFCSVCGIVGIMVTKAEMPKVMKIRVSCEDKAMCGNYSVNDNEAELINDEPIDGNNSVVLNCGSSGKTISDNGTMFYIPVPPGKYKNIKIELSSDGTSYDKVMNAKQDSADIPVNTIWHFLPVGSYRLSQNPTVKKMM